MYYKASIRFVLFMNYFSQRLRKLRGDANQTSFAEKLGLKQAVYSHYETNRREPDLNTLCKIAKILGVSADYLLGLSDEDGVYQPATEAGGVIKESEKSRERKGA